MENDNASSEHLQDDDTFPLEINYIPECVRMKSDEELNLPQEERNNRLLELIKLLEGNTLSQGIIFHKDFLQCYLIHSRYDVNRAFSRLKNYLNLNKNHNYFFQSIKFDFTEHPSCKFITLLPRRCSDGTLTLLYEMGNWNPSEIPFEVVKQLTFMIYMHELRNPVTQLAGVNAIFDFTNIGFHHLKYCTPYNIHLLNQVSFEIMPVIYRRYHLINGNLAMKTLLSLIKPFLPSYLKKIILIHSSADELLEYYPRSLIPKKYGGSLEEYYMADKLKKINDEHGHYIVEGQRNTF